MKNSLIKIPVDFNTIYTDSNERVLIPTHISPNLLKELKSGLKVILYEENDFEVEGELIFERKTSTWIAIPDWSTIKYYNND